MVMAGSRLKFTPIEKRANEGLSRDLVRFNQILDRIENGRRTDPPRSAIADVRTPAEIRQHLDCIDDCFRQIADEATALLPTPNRAPSRAKV
jgi:hypothetical protein